MSQLTTPKTPQIQIDFEAKGLGILRSTGANLVLFLSLEAAEDRAAILAYVAKELGIAWDDLSAAYHNQACSECGMGTTSHHNGVCP